MSWYYVIITNYVSLLQCMCVHTYTLLVFAFSLSLSLPPCLISLDYIVSVYICTCKYFPIMLPITCHQFRSVTCAMCVCVCMCAWTVLKCVSQYVLWCSLMKCIHVLVHFYNYVYLYVQYVWMSVCSLFFYYSWLNLIQKFVQNIFFDSSQLNIFFQPFARQININGSMDR